MMAPMVYAMEVPSYDHMRFNSSSIFCKFWNGALRLSTLANHCTEGASGPDTLIFRSNHRIGGSIFNRLLIIFGIVFG